MAVFELQGMQFVLKPTTRKNVKALDARFSDSDGFLDLDQFDQYLELAKCIAKPANDESSFDKVDVDDLDIKVVEKMLANFLPSLNRIFAGVTDYSR